MTQPPPPTESDASTEPRALPAPDLPALPAPRSTPVPPREPPRTAEPALPRVPATRDDPQKKIQLDRMKRRATALLVVAAFVFAITTWLESQFPWLGFVRATAEAAMVGGLADWFAITALFRHPLGIPIPHTAIIPQRKDRIGRSLGGFVQSNFLSREVISARLSSLRVAERAARWISEPVNGRRIARHVASGLAGAANVMKDDEVQAMIDRALVAKIRKTQAAPVLGKALALVTAGNRHQELLDEAIRMVAGAVSRNEDLIRDRIRAESPWWVPEAVDERIHDKIVTGIDRTLQEINEDPHHPLRVRFDEALHRFIERLRTSPEMIEKAEHIKEELLENPAVQQFSATIWSDIKHAIVNYAERSEDAPPGAIEQGLEAAGRTVLADPELMAKIDGWITEGVLNVVEQYRDEVGQLITQTVGQWDAEATSQKIELQIGKDLQFVRINGTLVGGLVGLILYTIGRFF